MTARTLQDALDELIKVMEKGVPGPGGPRGAPLPIEDLALPVDRSRFPHVCPVCEKPAYIGFSRVDCSAGCRP